MTPMSRGNPSPLCCLSQTYNKCVNPVLYWPKSQLYTTDFISKHYGTIEKFLFEVISNSPENLKVLYIVQKSDRVVYLDVILDTLI